MVFVYQEFFEGYDVDLAELLGRAFPETNGYDDTVVQYAYRYLSRSRQCLWYQGAT